MQAEDIRIKTSFPDHRKTLKLIKKLGIKGVGHLVIMWAKLSLTRPLGVLTGYDVSDIEMEAKWDGEPGEYVQTLLEVGFLDYSPETGVYSLHDWEEHQEWVVKAPERSMRAKARAEKRWEDWHKTGGKKGQEEKRKSDNTVMGKDRKYWEEKARNEGPIRIKKGMEELGEMLARLGVPIIKEEEALETA